MKELVDYANMLVDEDEYILDTALLKSLEKILKHRKLVESIRKTDDDLHSK